ncbi:geranylgeranyl pyrophosphate synthase-like [Aricia agestis]|uniref:geranylgeranyl pyrophosphate synthase-like n=1 Tax=Aricia agestis TaxID=91739 RepID=UPI001C20567E|nr:geranylgeranyl pyrophosphate synthase-like [Aricia agestis]
MQKIQCTGLAGEVGQVYSEQMLSALRGRGLEIYWRDNNYWPSEEEYNQMVEDNLLRRPVKDVEAKQYFLSELERLGSFEYTRDVLLNIDLQARGEVDRLGGNPEMEYVLDELLAWRTLDRRSKYEMNIRERFDINKI